MPRSRSDPSMDAEKGPSLVNPPITPKRHRCIHFKSVHTLILLVLFACNIFCCFNIVGNESQRTDRTTRLGFLVIMLIQKNILFSVQVIFCIVVFVFMFFNCIVPKQSTAVFIEGVSLYRKD